MEVTGSKPRATRKGAAIAAGAPAPAAPSRKMGSIMPMMMTWTRRSSLMPEMVAFTSSMAPVSRSRFKMVKAPKTISTILRPSLMPFQTRGSRTFTMSAKEMRSTLKKVKARTMVQRKAMGETFFADCLKPRMPTKTTRIGLSAMIKLKNSMGMSRFLNLLFYFQSLLPAGQQWTGQNQESGPAEPTEPLFIGAQAACRAGEK